MNLVIIKGIVCKQLGVGINDINSGNWKAKKLASRKTEVEHAISENLKMAHSKSETNLAQ